MLYLVPLLAALAAASPAMVPKHILKQVPSGWKFHSDAPSSLKINMHIGLREQNLDELEKRLSAMSDPSHADYGKHMTKDEIEALTAPSKASVDAVNSWLNSHGVKAGKVSSGFMAVTMTAEQAEKMLDTKYGVYYNADKKQYTVRTTKYSLPEPLHSDIETVQPTTMFSDMNMFDSRARKETSVSFARAEARQSGCSGSGITPSCLRSLYNVNYTPQQNKTSVGVTGYLGEVASISDLSQFLEQYTSVPSSAKFDVQLVNGGSNSGQGTIEADLDTQ